MAEEPCENADGGLTCSEMFNCCDCGNPNDEGYGCGCPYCWSCNACNTCLGDREEA